MKKTNIFILLLCLFSLYSCLEDNGNYDYADVNEAKIRFSTSNYSAVLGDTITMSPVITYADPSDTARFSYEWYVDGKLETTDRVLKLCRNEVVSYTCVFMLVDSRTGVKQFEGQVGVAFTSPYLEGWMILYEKNDESEIGFISFKNTGSGVEYKPMYDQYRAMNDNTSLGKEPVKLVQHFARGGGEDEVLVIQRGGQGNVELNGRSLVKEILMKQEFLDEKLPDDFMPVDATYPQYRNLILNHDGKLYSRFIQTPNLGFHTAAYNDVPFQYADDSKKGMEISQIILNAYHRTQHVMLHDRLHNRFLCMNMGSTSTAGVIYEMACATAYPKDYAPLDGMGDDVEMLFASSYADAFNGICSYAMILKWPDGEYTFQRFNYNSYKNENQVTLPGKDATQPFDGWAYITPETEFFMLRRTGDFLFFTGGTNNDILYYYSVPDKKTFLYKDFAGERITSLHPNLNSKQLGVGLENGEFVLFDVSSATAVATRPVIELYRKEGFGKIKDIIYKYSSATNLYM